MGTILGEGLGVIGAMDVDIAIKGIDSGAGVKAFLEAAQAEDAGGDKVALGGTAVGAVLPAFTGGKAAAEDGSGGGVVAVEGGDFVEPPGSPEGILKAGAGAPAGGNGIVVDLFPTVEVMDFFLAKVGHEDIFRSV